MSGKREYPTGPLASTIIGFRRKDGTAGVGLEAQLDRILSSKDGQRVVLGDAGRRGIWANIKETQLPKDGGNIFLTIDLQIQGYLQQALARTVEKYKAQWATGIVINPWSGEILGMCSYPNFDPNYYNETDIEKMANKCISSPYEPGSVFKPIVAASAVDNGVLTYATKIFCEKRYIPRTPWRAYHRPRPSLRQYNSRNRHHKVQQHPNGQDRRETRQQGHL